MPINSQAKGKRAERDLANWWKVNGYPDAERAVKTGTKQTHDAGDLILEHGDFRLCVEVKHHAGGLTDLQVMAFGQKLQQQIVRSKSDMGILVERRDRVSDPGRWWAHVHGLTFATLAYPVGPTSPHLPARIGPTSDFRPVRVQLAYLADLLRAAGLADLPGLVSTSDLPGHDESGAMAERPQAVGGT